jgi:hypothetical protein
MLVAAAACGGSSSSSSAPAIALVTAPAATPPPQIEVTGLSNDLLTRLKSAHLTPEQWSSVLRVAVDAEGPAMLGEYRISDGAVRFIPAFPLDPGRDYRVRFDPRAVLGGEGQIIENVVRRPAEHTEPSTTVARVYPSGAEVPANLLRMYIEFSAPMGRVSGVPFMKLLDHHGAEIAGAFLPLDYEFWSPDHTRFTAFFDPGRVKRGILPNQQMGRPLEAGKTVTLVISREWRDQYGLPLRDEFRRSYRVAPPDQKPLDAASWQLQPPAPETRDPLVVTFPKALDHGLLMRALGVRSEGRQVAGDIRIEEHETQWTFTPAAAWEEGVYELVALDVLEDPAGNQIGRAFEVDNFDTVDKSPKAKTITIPFNVDPHAHH